MRKDKGGGRQGIPKQGKSIPGKSLISIPEELMEKLQVGPPLRRYPTYLLPQEGTQSTFTEVRASALSPWFSSWGASHSSNGMLNELHGGVGKDCLCSVVPLQPTRYEKTINRLESKMSAED